MAAIWGKTYTRHDLLQRVGDIRQLAKAEAFEFSEGSERGVRAVAVHKLRRHYTMNECMVEVTEVVADRHGMRTLAVESPDAARVVATVAELGLSKRPNTSYPRRLKADAGMED